MADVTESCGVMTPKGPCTMKKGHESSWHRHRLYNKTYWRIVTGLPEVVVEYGSGRVPLQYAISRALDNYDKFSIEVERDGPARA